MIRVTWDIVDDIRLDYSTGDYNQKELAKKYKVSQQLIWAVVNYRTWVRKNNK